MGAEVTFRLGPGGLDWIRGGNSRHVPYRNVRRIHMSYKPASMQSHRFVTEMWAEGSAKLQIVSTSWKSMVELQRQDAAYSGFVAELHRRVGRDAAAVRYEQGVSGLVYWPGLALFVVVGVLLAGLIVRSLQETTLGATAFISVLLALFLWQGGNFFHRNRPRRYRPDALPPELMPKGSR
jgi:hypothetical protein